MDLTIILTIASLEPSTGGPARSVPYLAKSLQNKFGKIKIFVEDEYNDSHSIVGNIEADSVNNLSNYIEDLGAKGIDKAIIHNHGIWLPINHYVTRLALKKKIPLITSPRGMLEPWSRSHKWFKKTIAWYCYQRQDLRKVSLIHATSHMEAENIQKYGLNLPIAVIPNGIDPPQNTKSAAKKNKKIKTALFLSRIHPKKGLLNLVKAWHNVLPTDWQVLIAGPDESDHKSRVVREIRSHGLDEIFKFIGEVRDSDKWELYKNADLFILPTFSENFGIVILEALACGVPVITTKCAPWQDLHLHRCGWWVKPDIGSLSMAISEAVNLSDQDRHDMGVNGRKLVLDKFSWKKIAEEMSEVYWWVINGGRSPNCVVLP